MTLKLIHSSLDILPHQIYSSTSKTAHALLTVWNLHWTFMYFGNMVICFKLWFVYVVGWIFLFDWHLRLQADPNVDVRGRMINAGIFIIDKHGRDNVALLFPIFENYLNKKVRSCYWGLELAFNANVILMCLLQKSVLFSVEWWLSV